MKKIMFYIDSLTYGGAERVMANLSNQFVEADYNVVFVTSWNVEKEYVLSPKIQRYSLEKSRMKYTKIYKNIKRIFQLRSIVKKEKPDVLISFLGTPNFRAILSCLGLKTKNIVSVRNDPNQEYGSFFSNLAQKMLFPHADGIVFQTKDAKNWFPSKIQEKSKIIFNQVDLKFFNTEKKDEKYYVAIGRLESQKNQKLLIEAFTEFAKKYPDEKLYIYGDGDLKEELHAQIESNHAENHIFLMGTTNNVPEVLSYAKAYVMTSDYEGMPNTVLESMSVGVPVICTDCPCGGPRMVIQSGENGLLFPVNDKNALLTCLDKIQSDKDFREKIGKNAKCSANAFKPDVVFEEWKRFTDLIIGVAQ